MKQKIDTKLVKYSFLVAIEFANKVQLKLICSVF
jgi:hypothetical protein